MPGGGDGTIPIDPGNTFPNTVYVGPPRPALSPPLPPGVAPAPRSWTIVNPNPPPGPVVPGAAGFAPGRGGGGAPLTSPLPPGVSPGAPATLPRPVLPPDATGTGIRPNAPSTGNIWVDVNGGVGMPPDAADFGFVVDDGDIIVSDFGGGAPQTMPNLFEDPPFPPRSGPQISASGEYNDAWAFTFDADGNITGMSTDFYAGAAAGGAEADASLYGGTLRNFPGLDPTVTTGSEGDLTTVLRGFGNFVEDLFTRPLTWADAPPLIAGVFFDFAWGGVSPASPPGWQATYGADPPWYSRPISGQFLGALFILGLNQFPPKPPSKPEWDPSLPSDFDQPWAKPRPRFWIPRGDGSDTGNASAPAPNVVAVQT